MVAKLCCISPQRGVKESGMPFISVQGTRLFWRSFGSGPVVLLLHGLGSSIRDWEYQVPYLSRRFRVLACDMRGHGKSDFPPGPYSVELFARDAAALIEAERLAPARLVGISMGGMVGLQLAISRPELVGALVMCNAGPRLRFDRLKARVNLAVRRALLRCLGMKTVGRKLAWEMFPEPDQEEFRLLVMQRWAENDRRAYADSLRAILEWNAEGKLSSVRCPVLVLRGELDRTPMDLDPQAAGLPAGSRRVVIAGARHAACIDRADEFNRLVEEFLLAAGQSSTRTT